jgi:hypothetical protein
VSEQGSVEKAAAEALSIPKYPQPKILLMDLEAEVEETLKQAGYNVETGSFGAPVKVSAEPEYALVPLARSSPNETEQEIVVLDNGSLDPVERELPDLVEGESHFWQLANKGTLDPRPISMFGHQYRSFDRILDHGGVFICFVDREIKQDYLFAKKEWGQFEEQEQLKASNWEFLTAVRQVGREVDFGKEITPTDLGEEVPGLKAALRDAEFQCVLDVDDDLEGGWAPLALNKFGATVAAAMTRPRDGGVVLLLPRVKDKARLVLRLIAEFVPRFASQFYPHIKSSAWVKEAPYELPEVQGLQEEIAEIRKQADAAVKEIETKIETKREERGFLYGLLTATDSELVTAVKQTLELIGFNDVVDVDEESGSNALKREDLQIRDRKPILLVEVKGITGMPKEAYSLQVDKYVMPRAEEWGHFDVRGLTVINHQLSKVALEREHEHVFQESVITNAKGRKFGLLTTWTLFRLARAYLRYGWEHEHVADLFHKHGVIEAVPTHYELVGTVNKLFEDAGAVAVDLAGEISVGDTLAYELPVEFEQEKIDSLQLENEAVEKAEPGVEIGINTSLTKEQARKGTRIFKVNQL